MSRNLVVGSFFIGGYLLSFTSQGAVVCLQGARLHKSVENKVKVESCVKRKSPCPVDENTEIIPGSSDPMGGCEISHGKTRYENPDGSELILNYNNGKLHGKAISRSYKKVKLSEENYISGQKQGKQETFFASRKKKSKENYINGLKHGEQVSWFENGELERKTEYLDGHPSGTWTLWYSSGRKKAEYTFGTLGWEGLYRDWYPNGRLHLAAQYLNGHLEGTYSLYYPNGKRMSERRYSKGILEGLFEEWEPSGEKVATSQYHEGKFKEWIEAPVFSSLERDPAAFPGHSTSHLKADLDGNGYLDDILSFPEKPDQTKVLLNVRERVMKELIIPQTKLNVYSARTVEGQVGEPITSRDGLVAWGKGKETKVYLYDFESENFEVISYASDLDF